jgi:hypothetical protein
MRAIQGRMVNPIVCDPSPNAHSLVANKRKTANVIYCCYATGSLWIRGTGLVGTLWHPHKSASAQGTLLGRVSAPVTLGQ